VSTFILTTPLLTAVVISSLLEPEPPWKTRYLKTVNIYIEKNEANSQGFLLLATQLRIRVGLMLFQEFRVQLDVPRLVHTVHVSKRSSDAEVGADLDQRIVHIVHVLWLSVQCGVIDTSVVYTVLLSTGDTDLHLEPDPKGSQFLEIFNAYLDILLLGFLGEIKHVRGKEGFLVDFVILLVGSEHTIEPRKEFVRTVVAVEHDGTTNDDPT
jgi:hypothetical protein